METNINTIIEEMHKELEELRATHQTKAKELLNKSFKHFFDSCPEVTAVMWRQYTPYFNDGDECVFRCYIDYACVTNAPDYENAKFGSYDGSADPESIWIDDPDYGDFNSELIPAHVINESIKLRSALSKLPKDIYKDVFGDHVTVAATKDGFEVFEYEHD